MPGGNVTDRTVGIIGLGIMGGAIARNLVERGWTVVGFDTEPARRSELALAGVTIADGTVRLLTTQPEAVLRELFRRGIEMSELEVSGADLEDAFISLTTHAGTS